MNNATFVVALQRKAAAASNTTTIHSPVSLVRTDCENDGCVRPPSTNHRQGLAADAPINVKLTALCLKSNDSPLEI